MAFCYQKFAKVVVFYHCWPSRFPRLLKSGIDAWLVAVLSNIILHCPCSHLLDSYSYLIHFMTYVMQIIWNCVWQGVGSLHIWNEIPRWLQHRNFNKKAYCVDTLPYHTFGIWLRSLNCWLFLLGMNCWHPMLSQKDSWMEERPARKWYVYYNILNYSMLSL